MKREQPRWLRPILIVAGCAFLTIGVIGLIVPLLPGVVFLLLAAACFSRSSPQLDAWLRQHRRFGPVIRDWEASGAMARKPKWLATVSLAISAGLLTWSGPPDYVLGVGLIAIVLVTLFIWRLPEPDGPS